MARNHKNGNGNGVEMADATDATASAQFSDKASELRSVIQEIASLVPEAASEQLCTLKDKALELCQSTGEKAKDLGTKAYSAAKEHPMKAALLGVGAAAVAWWLIGRRHAA